MEENMDMKMNFIVLGIVMIVFLYYGYKDDYKRNPKEFKKSIFGVLVLLLVPIFGIFGLSALIDKWFNSDEEITKNMDGKSGKR